MDDRKALLEHLAPREMINQHLTVEGRCHIRRSLLPMDEQERVKKEQQQKKKKKEKKQKKERVYFPHSLDICIFYFASQNRTIHLQALNRLGFRHRL